MTKILAGAIAAVAIVAGAGAARAETCIWLGYWACGENQVYNRVYYPPAAPAYMPVPVPAAPDPAGRGPRDFYGPRPY